METPIILERVRGQLIAVTNICAILLATHPDVDGIMPIVRNLAKAERDGDTGFNNEICAGIADVLSQVEIILSARTHKRTLTARRTKMSVKAN